MLESNEKVLARYFNKKNGVFLYSGTLAIEYALRMVEGISGKHVLLQNNVCFNVLLSVLRVGAIPVLVQPQNHLILTVDEIFEAAKKSDAKAIIIVHHLGIPINIKEIRNGLPDIIIIEDSAQYFYAEEDEIYDIGKYSDILVTSFGRTKPISLGIGGGIFSDRDLLKLANYDSVSARYNSSISLPYLLPRNTNIDIKELITKAKITVSNQRNFSELLLKYLRGLPVFHWKINNYGISWHRFPIWCYCEEYYKLLINTVNMYNIQYQLPHKNTLEALPILKEHKFLFYNFSNKPMYFILIKTLGNNIKDVELWINHLTNLSTQMKS